MTNLRSCKALIQPELRQRFPQHVRLSRWGAMEKSAFWNMQRLNARKALDKMEEIGRAHV